MFFAVSLVAVVLNIAAGIIAMRRFEDSRATPVLLAVALFAAGITHQPYHRLDFIHLLFVAFLTVGFLPVSFLVFASAMRGQLLRPPLAGPLGAGVAALLFLCMPSIRSGTIMALTHPLGTTSRSSFLVKRNGRDFPLFSPTTAMLVEQMLEASRLEESALVLNRERIDMRDICRGSAATFRPLLDGRHRLELVEPEDSAMVLADPNRVGTVLANLFMHYAFDQFLAREFPSVDFERYADDAVVH